MPNKKRAVMLKVLADFRLGLSLTKERGHDSSVKWQYA